MKKSEYKNERRKAGCSSSSVLFSISDDEYRSEDGATLKREWGETPNGNRLNGKWVLRGPNGEWIDFNQYRHDIASHHGLTLVENAELSGESPLK